MRENKQRSCAWALPGGLHTREASEQDTGVLHTGHHVRKALGVAQRLMAMKVFSLFFLQNSLSP